MVPIAASLWLVLKRSVPRNCSRASSGRSFAHILARIAERAAESRYPLTPQRIVHDGRQVMPEDGIVCLDNGMYKIRFARNYRTRVANTLLLGDALATMGAGLPSATPQRLSIRTAGCWRCAAMAGS